MLDYLCENYTTSLAMHMLSEARHGPKSPLAIPRLLLMEEFLIWPLKCKYCLIWRQVNAE